MGSSSANLPAELVRRFDVVVKPAAKQRPLRLREVSADHIGRLVVLQVSSLSSQSMPSPAALVGSCMMNLYYANQMHLLGPSREALGKVQDCLRHPMGLCRGQ